MLGVFCTACALYIGQEVKVHFHCKTQDPQLWDDQFKWDGTSKDNLVDAQLPLDPQGHAMWAVPDIERPILHLSTIPKYSNAGRPCGHPDKTSLWQVLKGCALSRAQKPPSWSRCMDVK